MIFLGRLDNYLKGFIGGADCEITLQESPRRTMILGAEPGFLLEFCYPNVS